MGGRGSFDTITDMIRDKPSESWLLIARSNFYAQRLQSALSKRGVPWNYTKAAGGYVTPKNRRIGKLLFEMQYGNEITSDDWSFIAANLPAKLDGQAIFRHGLKAELKRAPLQWPVCVQNIEQSGGTEFFRLLIETGKWPEIDKSLGIYNSAIDRYGFEYA